MARQQKRHCGRAAQISSALHVLMELLFCCRYSKSLLASSGSPAVSFLSSMWSPGYRVIGSCSSMSQMTLKPVSFTMAPALRSLNLKAQGFDEGIGRLPHRSRQAKTSRRNFLENGARSAVGGMGLAVVSSSGRHAAEAAAGVFFTGAVGWGFGKAEGVQSAKAFGGPSRPLNRCLVNTINAREFCKRLEGELAVGKNVQECRGMVKGILRGLNLQECVKDAVMYLPRGKRQAAIDAGQSAVEYLASVVEFDAWDKLDKDWTSNVALRNMTPDNVVFVRRSLDAAGESLDQFFGQFDRADIDDARNLYRAYFLPAEERQSAS